MQPAVVHIFCFSFCRFCCFCRCLRCALYYQQSYVCPSVSRIPYSVSRYAICRVPFPDLCNSMHVPHFCSKTCRTCMWCMAATKIPQKVPQTLNLKHVARCTNSAASSLIEFATATVCRCEAALDKPRQAVAHNSCYLPLATAMKWQLAAAPCLVARQKPLCKRKHQIVN